MVQALSDRRAPIEGRPNRPTCRGVRQTRAAGPARPEFRCHPGAHPVVDNTRLPIRNGRANPEITRFKGLGEMMPKVLWETTLNPRTRRLLRVDIADHIVTDRVINELMGKDPSARFRFIMERAEEAVELDV